MGQVKKKKCIIYTQGVHVGELYQAVLGFAQLYANVVRDFIVVNWSSTSHLSKALLCTKNQRWVLVSTSPPCTAKYQEAPSPPAAAAASTYQAELTEPCLFIA